MNENIIEHEISRKSDSIFSNSTKMPLTPIEKTIIALVSSSVNRKKLEEIIEQEGCLCIYIGGDPDKVASSLLENTTVLLDIEAKGSHSKKLRQYLTDRSCQTHLVSSANYGEIPGHHNNTANHSNLITLLRNSLSSEYSKLPLTTNDINLDKIINQHLIISETDEKGLITYVNNKFCELSGYTQKELIGRKHSIVNSNQHNPDFFKNMWATINSGNIWHGRICNRKKDGSLYWVESTITPKRTKNKDIKGYISVRTDISAIINHRINERKIRLRIEQYQKSTQSLLQKSLHTDTPLKKKLNQLCSTICDSTNSDTVLICEYIENKCLLDVITKYSPKENHQNKSKKHEILLSEAQNKDIKTSLDKPTIKFLRKSIHLLKNLWGETNYNNPPLRGIRINISITNSQKNIILFIFDQKKGLYNRSTFNFIVSSSNFIARYYEQEQLKQAKEEAEQANLSKSKFVSRISHELRTPLHAIIGFGQLLLDNKESPEKQDMLNNIKNIIHAGEHLQFLINDLIDLAAIESYKIHLDIKKVDPVKIAEECLIFVQNSALKKNIDLITNFNISTEDSAWADGKRAQQILLNLLSNAIKYSPLNSKVIIDVYSNEKNIGFKITDQGDGISIENQNKLFTPFERVGQEKSNIEGIGIGLIIAKNLAEIMSGNLNFSSKESIGSKFWFEIPKYNAIPSKEKIEHKKNTSINQKNLLDLSNILCVEDNIVNQKLLQGIFKSRPDIHVTYCNKPSEALSILNNKKFNLFLLDINLPEMNGNILLEEIRFNPLYKNTPAIALTADTNFLENLSHTTFCTCLIKPFSIKGFLPVIDNYLNLLEK